MPLDTQCKDIKTFTLLFTQNGVITERKTSKLQMPHNTSITFSVTYENPVTINVHMEGGIVYTTTWLMNTRALSGEEVAPMWKITTRKYITVIGKSSRK